MDIKQIKKYMEDKGIKMHFKDDSLFLVTNTPEGNQVGFKITLIDGDLMIVCKTFLRLAVNKDAKKIITKLLDVNSKYRYYSFNINDTSEIILKHAAVADFVTSSELVIVMMFIAMGIVDSLVKEEFINSVKKYGSFKK